VKKKINPLSRRTKQKRLVIAVRGAAGAGKSHFAASLADAGVGRLCLFDVERKARLLTGVNNAKPKFDAIEIHQPDELPEFIDWAIDGEGKE
jgi:predicted YcjX-like family ATPase